MAKFFTLSPDGVPENQVLFPTMRLPFQSQGHEFVHKPYQAEIIFIDLHTRIADYSQEYVDYIIDSCKPICTWDEWDRGSLSTDQWPHPLTPQQQQIFKHIEDKGIKAVHFCRLLDKTKTYPTNVFPFEKTVLYEEPLLTPEQLFEREWDIIFIANQAPSRDSIAEAIIKDGRFKYVVRIGEEKIPFDKFVNIHKQGKMFISSAAGGYGDERVQCLFSIAGIIKQRTDQLFLHDFVHLDNCIRIDSPPTKQDLDTLYEIVNDKERLYQIYLNGYNFVKKYYSSEYIASNILETMKKEGII